MTRTLVSENGFYALHHTKVTATIAINHILMKRGPRTDAEFLEYEKAFVSMYSMSDLFCLIVEFHGDLDDIEFKYVTRKLALIKRMVAQSKAKIMCSAIVATFGKTVNRIKDIMKMRPPSTPYRMVPTLEEATAYVDGAIRQLTAPVELRPASKSETVSLLMTVIYDILEEYDNGNGLLDYKDPTTLPVSC